MLNLILSPGQHPGVGHVDSRLRGNGMAEAYFQTMAQVLIDTE